MTATATADADARRSPRSSRGTRSARCCSATSRVLCKEIWMFLGRTIIQPLLLIFVFTYVFPKIGQAIGGAAARRRSRRCSSAASSRAR